MIRIPAAFLSALLVVAPALAAFCADGCDVEMARIEVVPMCGHADASADLPAMRATACPIESADVVLAEARTAGVALTRAVDVTTAASGLLPPPERQRYLQHQPPSPPARVTLRI